MAILRWPPITFLPASKPIAMLFDPYEPDGIRVSFTFIGERAEILNTLIGMFSSTQITRSPYDFTILLTISGNDTG